MPKRVVLAICLLLPLSVGQSRTLQGQGEKEKPTVYTYVAQWAVARAQWPDVKKALDQDLPTFDKLIADGTIVGYGVFESVIHKEGTPTHGMWFSTTSMGATMKTLEALAAQPPSPGDAALSSSKHWDEILESNDYGGHSGAFKGAYMDGTVYQAKPGRGRDLRALIKSTILPILDKLLADGVIHSYSFDSQAYHTDKPGAFDVVYTAADAAALDKAEAAFEAALAKNDSIGAAMASLTDSDEHRDFLLRVSTMKSK